MSKIQCPNCTYVGTSVNETPGHFLIELILWLIFFPIGLIYSIWRLSKRHKVCPHCRFDHVYDVRHDIAAERTTL